MTVGWGKKETQFHGSQGKPKPQAGQKPVSHAVIIMHCAYNVF